MRLVTSAVILAVAMGSAAAQVANERVQRRSQPPATVAVGIANTGRGEPTWSFRELDRNGDRELSRVEFNRAARDVFRAWDINQNYRIEGIEFYRALFASCDLDRDGRISDKEFARAAAFFGRGSERVDFIAWDVDRNGAIDLQEFRAGWTAAGLFARWDLSKDMWLSDQELDAGLFSLWDADGSGNLAENEFNEGNAFAWF